MRSALLQAADHELAGHLEHGEAESLWQRHGRGVRLVRDKLRPYRQRRSALAGDSGLAARSPCGGTSVRRILVHQRKPVNALTRVDTRLDMRRHRYTQSPLLPIEFR